MREIGLTLGVIGMLACGPGSVASDEVPESDDEVAPDTTTETGESESTSTTSTTESTDTDEGRLPDFDIGEAEFCEFVDPYLEQLVAQELGLDSGPIPVELALQVTWISVFLSKPDVPGEHPVDLGGIECVALLEYLRLPPGKIDDLGPLASLAELSSLWISRNEISDLGPLAELESLSYLWLSENQVAILDPLAGVDTLTELHLQDNPLPEGELADIAGLPLEQLNVGHTQITSLDDILLFEDLERLSIDGLPIDSIAPLQATKISGLSINDTPVDDLSPLLEWAAPIKCLAIAGTPISDISLLLEIDWNTGGCYSSCPSLYVDENQLDDFSKEVVIPQLCDMGIEVNGCLICPQ